LLGTLEFELVLSDDGLLDQIAASLIDRMRNVCIEFIGGTLDIVQILIAP
jgi:hypothetical protein